MLWNWNTIGACFITPQWQVGSRGAMIGTCFGVVFLVMALEALRRATKAFDRWIVRRHNRAAEARYRQVSPAAPTDAHAHAAGRNKPLAPAAGSCCAVGGGDGAVRSRKSSSTATGSDVSGGGVDAASGLREQKSGQGAGENCCAPPPCRPNVWQQGLRALLHAAQFTAAYFIML